MKYLFWLVAALTLSLFCYSSASAQSLQISPLQYQTTLSHGQRKKGIVDITNPGVQPVAVEMNVQAFRQIDDKGTLQFYDDPTVSNGVIPDLHSFTLGAHGTMRLYFMVDGTKLPSGDVFAALFARVVPTEGMPGVGQSVRVGTLLSIVNGTPGSRKATITHLTVPFFQWGTAINGMYTIKNTAEANTASGFFPKVSIRVWPLGPNTITTGPLIYAGNARTVPINQPSNQLGIYKITASYGDSSKSQWIVLVTGIWRWILLASLGVLFVVLIGYKMAHKRRRKRT